MYSYRISYSYDGAACSRIYHAESEGEAIEQFQERADASDANIEFIGCVEVEGV